jgi:hypothetical protein
MNKESTWEECIGSSSSIKVSIDKEKVKSLREIAIDRAKYLKENKIKDNNANFIFESYYSSILELLHALVLLQGYKVTNHICLGYYIRDILLREDLFRKFDDCRFKRNSLIYYGKRMDFTTAVDAIKKSINIIKELSDLIKIN